MQPDMLIAALPTDLHLYARPPVSCSIPPLVPMSWPPIQLIARPRSKLRPEGAFLRPTSQPDPGVKHPFSGPFKPATHPVDRRDELRQAAQWCLWADPLTQSEQIGEPPCTESNISPNISCLQPCRGRSWLYADYLVLRGHWRAVVRLPWLAEG